MVQLWNSKWWMSWGWNSGDVPRFSLFLLMYPTVCCSMTVAYLVLVGDIPVLVGQRLKLQLQGTACVNLRTWPNVTPLDKGASAAGTRCWNSHRHWKDLRRSRHRTWKKNGKKWKNNLPKKMLKCSTHIIPSKFLQCRWEAAAKRRTSWFAASSEWPKGGWKLDSSWMFMAWHESEILTFGPIWTYLEPWPIPW